ncbi:WhiB family transcriptional regulator [Embleya sp. NPDC056575]|uniref:WhiB family transcriptional regulator n=1 Tax=unclassified Embleya TaxID=2699296 RepID=UPI0036779168
MSRLPAVRYDTSTTSTDPGYRWWEHAACTGESLRTFYPDRSEGTADALKVCRACPVRGDCLAEEIRLTAPLDRHGVRGGLPQDKRRTYQLRADTNGATP